MTTRINDDGTCELLCLACSHPQSMHYGESERGRPNEKQCVFTSEWRYADHRCECTHFLISDTDRLAMAVEKLAQR